MDPHPHAPLGTQGSGKTPYTHTHTLLGMDPLISHPLLIVQHRGCSSHAAISPGPPATPPAPATRCALDPSPEVAASEQHCQLAGASGRRNPASLWVNPAASHVVRVGKWCGEAPAQPGTSLPSPRAQAGAILPGRAGRPGLIPRGQTQRQVWGRRAMPQGRGRTVIARGFWGHRALISGCCPVPVPLLPLAEAVAGLVDTSAGDRVDQPLAVPPP